MDVLSASYNDGRIAWYENDGDENFTTHTITTSADGAYSVYALDVDGDGDMDVLSASLNDDKIAWYENDGDENFTPHTITASADVARWVYAVDVDGDEDMDVLSASSGDHKIVWYENDGDENFIPHTITTSAIDAWLVYAVDVDGDGDIDVLSASAGDDKIAWYENDGNENFTTHTITTDAIGARTVYAVDMDGDGDVDVLSASQDDDKIAWYENLNPPIPVELISFTANVNAEGNVVLNWNTATELNNQMFEIERRTKEGQFITIGYVDGYGTTTEPQEYSYIDNKVGTGLHYYRLKQIDNNGTFEYSKIIEINVDAPLEFELSQNYPNPFNPSTNISYALPTDEFVNLTVYNVLGKTITTLVNEQKLAGSYVVSFDASDFPSGVYFYKLIAGNYVSIKKMMLIK